MTDESIYLKTLENWIDLIDVPFTERGSRLVIYRSDQSLNIRLTERWFKREHQLSAYRRRPPLIDQLIFTGDGGQPLALQITTQPHRLNIQTEIGLYSIVFLDQETLQISLPQARCGLQFVANLDRAEVDRRGCVMRLTGDIRRNIAYTTNARILKNEVEPYGEASQRIHLEMDASGQPENAALLLNITPRLGFNRYIPDQAGVIDAAARRWHEWFAAVPEPPQEFWQQYYYAWWVMRAGLISTRYYTTREAMTPSKMYYVGIWQWDAYFHAIAYRHIDKRLAHDQLRILLDHQREDGMIPDAVHDEGIVTHLDFPIDADVTKPPLLAWAALKLYEMDGDREFLDEIYQPIVRWNQWWFRENDRDGNGLCEYGHPFSSGLDDSPLWDEGMPVEAPDLNTYLIMQLDSLAKIAKIIGEKKDAQHWRRRTKETVQRMLTHLWDHEAGLFWAKKNGQAIRVRTPFNLFPFITGYIPPEICHRLVAQLTDERQFWPRFPVPTVALDDPKFDPLQMWRGPTWVNINYLLIEGLFKSDYPEEARLLRRRTLELLSSHHDLYEYYHPISGEKPPKAAAIFGWTSSVFIDLVIQLANEQKGLDRKGRA